MNASNLEDVGQMRMRRGISMKTMINAQARQMTLKMMIKLKLKMFAMPRAKHSTMQMTPLHWP